MTVYLKKPDGTIEQYKDELRQALRIDTETQGESFGTIYTADSLPDEDKLALGLITQKEYTTLIKTRKIQEIKSNFEIEISTGNFDSAILGIKVDCRRSGTKNDLQNVQGLISYIQRNNLTGITYVGYNTKVTNVTVERLQTLCTEMEDYVLSLYDKKWTKEQEIDLAVTKEDIENIVW